MEIKVNLATTLPLIDESRPIKSRLVVASFPERSNRMWRYFEQRRYEIVHKGGDSTVDDELYKQVRAPSAKICSFVCFPFVALINESLFFCPFFR